MRRSVIAVALLATLTAACGTSGAGGTAAGGTAGSAQPGGGGGTMGGIPSRKIELGMSARGRTVTVHPNDVVELRLGSMYWHVHPVTGGVLSRGRFQSLPGHGPPGVGGTVVATFRVLKAGTAHITAARQSCGEAMRCVGGQGSFTVTVVAH